ncbi:MAG: peptide-methionine (S)-S-oxide reductase MsrA [Nitrospirota bacterium]
MHKEETVTNNAEIVTLGCGCFWCLEAVFNEIHGIDKVVSGYAGGGVPNPSYEEVCTGTTGYAEVVQIRFDPGVISFREILEVFFAIHDPTTLNRQAADVGTQYRSVVFFHTPGQREVTEKLVIELNSAQIWDVPIVTEVRPFVTFYPAEEYHQGYFQRNSAQPYCQSVIAPKVTRFRKEFFSKLRK